MSQTLGEKLRKAREERGISISEVAEQTRISSLYLESIENDDYKILPGGIFNKGFVKSYAKYVGVDEHEALQDYSNLVARNEGTADDHLRVYRPEVLTDDRSLSSMAPTIIFAVIILGLMTAGILFGVNYYQNRQDPPTVASNTDNSNRNTAAGNTSSEVVRNNGAPEMGAIKVEFKSIGADVSVSAVNDGAKSSVLITPARSNIYEPKEQLLLSYSKSLASAAQLTINGRSIALPETPENPRRAAIEFEINKDNLATIWNSGKISFERPTPQPTEPAAVETVPAPTAAETVPSSTVTRTPTPVVRTTPRPTAPAKTPAAMPTRETIVVGQPTRTPNN